jgi:heme A synthase
MKRSRFATYAWTVLGYNLLVILWGAYVRATGSGAGCGDHWPLCNGEVIPRSPQAEMLVEFIHRATSGLALVLVAGMLIWAVRAYAKGHVVRLGAKLAMLFIVTEALIGAGLVLFKLVAGDDSLYRVVAIAAHLVNTFLLLAALALTAWWASGGAPLRLADRGPIAGALGAGMIGVMLVGAAGAVTALGDTLFPAGSLTEGLRQDFATTSHSSASISSAWPGRSVAAGPAGRPSCSPRR